MNQAQIQGENSIDDETDRTLVTNKKRTVYYTPDLALQILEPYLIDKGFARIWDPAAGPQSFGIFPVKSFFESKGKKVTATDVVDGPQFDFFNYKTRNWVDVIVTTPPYALRHRFIERAIILNKPFALFVPANILENKGIRALFKKFKVTVVYPPDNIKFAVPNDPKSIFISYHVWVLGGFDRREDMIFH